MCVRPGRDPGAGVFGTAWRPRAAASRVPAGSLSPSCRAGDRDGARPWREWQARRPPPARPNAPSSSYRRTVGATARGRAPKPAVLRGRPGRPRRRGRWHVARTATRSTAVESGVEPPDPPAGVRGESQTSARRAGRRPRASHHPADVRSTCQHRAGPVGSRGRPAGARRPGRADRHHDRGRPPPCSASSGRWPGSRPQARQRCAVVLDGPPAFGEHSRQLFAHD